MLPILNMNPSSTDTGKQITAIKSYINSLKDSIDDELSHISYEQLDASLKKRIDALGDTMKITEEQSEMVAQNIRANYLSASQIVANYATIGSLTAVSARLGTVEANYVGTEFLEANYATIGALSAATARIGTIESNYISAGAITAEFLNSKFSGTTGLSASRIYCDNYHVNAEGQSYVLTPQRLVIGGVSKIILGA